MRTCLGSHHSLSKENDWSCADPDRPKNDKATILGDSVQVVKELRSDVKRLKCEQASLLDESRDVSESLNLLVIH